MTTIVTDCPHCNKTSIGFTPKSVFHKEGVNAKYFVAGTCNGCNDPIIVLVSHKNGLAFDPNSIVGNLLNSDKVVVEAVWPIADPVEAPDAVPERVSKNYVEAVEAKMRGSWNAACGMYRRTMELALKGLAPEIEAWKIEKRIDKLASENKITPDIQSWAHELRLDGNAALHGEEDATKEMTEQMHHLTHFLLVYLYSLPQQIAEVRARRG